MELYPIQGGVVVLLVALCMETRISSGLGGGGVTWLKYRFHLS